MKERKEYQFNTLMFFDVQGKSCWTSQLKLTSVINDTQGSGASSHTPLELPMETSCSFCLSGTQQTHLFPLPLKPPMLLRVSPETLKEYLLNFSNKELGIATQTSISRARNNLLNILTGINT